VFLHDPDRRYTDFVEVRAEIARRTTHLAGPKKNVTDTPISLKICSPNVLNLTLVDLPGITKVAIADQPKDIEEQIRALTLKCVICRFTFGRSLVARPAAIRSCVRRFSQHVVMC
jgi:replication fork clamp-binding protein CrfC